MNGFRELRDRSAPGALRVGRHFSTIAKANNGLLLDDAGEYYPRLREALEKATHSVWILGWDFDGDTSMGCPTAGAPSLLDVLKKRCEEVPSLQVRIICWESHAVFVFERNPLSRFRLWNETTDQVQFLPDALYPLGGSHHQKYVVVDEGLAFVGGIDLTQRRWDTRTHEADNPDRLDSSGKPYGPFHDLQVVVDGEVASRLAQMAQERWTVLGGDWQQDSPKNPMAWPSHWRPDLVDVPVGISRTRGKAGKQKKVREIRDGLVDVIRLARHFIYIENQYLSARSIIKALCMRLRSPVGPEVLIVLPYSFDGWVQSRTMGPLVHQAVTALKKADKFGRLRVVAPVAGRTAGQGVFVHAKLLIADDLRMIVGSSNLNERSMSVDSECNVTFVASPGGTNMHGIRNVRARLLAAHCGVETEVIEDFLRRGGGILDIVDRFGGGEHGFVEFSARHTEPSAFLQSLPIDPCGPSMADALADSLGGQEESHGWLRRHIGSLGVLGLVLLCALVAFWMQGGQISAAVGEVLAYGKQIHPVWGAPWIVLAMVVASFAFVPVNLLYAMAVVGLGASYGGILGYVAINLACFAHFVVGRIGGEWLANKMQAFGANRYIGKIQGYGIWSVLFVRLIPVAPALVVNLALGLSRVKTWHLVLGSALGTLPGSLAFVFLGDRIRRALVHPSLFNLVWIGAAGLALFGLGAWIRRILERRGYRLDGTRCRLT